MLKDNVYFFIGTEAELIKVFTVIIETSKKGRKMESEKWYEEFYRIKLNSYEDIYPFIKSLNNDERRVIGYMVKLNALYDEVKVTFARLK